MTPFQTYQLWQIERPKATAEQRAADTQLGMIAAAVSRSARQAASTAVRAAALSRLRLPRSIPPGGAQIAARVAR